MLRLMTDAALDARRELRHGRRAIRAGRVEHRHDPGGGLRADQVAVLARTQAIFSAVLEQRLLRGLVLVFALSAAVVVAWFGHGWVAELGTVLPGGQDAVAWSGIAALCVLGNWGFGLLRDRIERGAHAA